MHQRSPSFSNSRASVAAAALLQLLVLPTPGQDAKVNGAPTPAAVAGREDEALKAATDKALKAIAKQQSAASLLLRSKDVAEVPWIEKGVSALQKKLSALKSSDDLPNSSAAVTAISKELVAYDALIEMYRELKALREDLDYPGLRSEGAVLLADNERLSKATEQRRFEARAGLDNTIEVFKLVSPSLSAEHSRSTFVGHFERAQGPAVDVLADLRDPEFCRADRLKSSLELAKPVLVWGGAAFGLALLSLMWRAVSQAKQRADKHMHDIDETRAARGTFSEQMQEVADATGRPIGGLMPQPKKRR